jgi:hypothetical protein
MSRYAFALATREDDAALRARMAKDRMEGAIAVSFRREPSYFDGCRVQGDVTQVVKCVDSLTGALTGLGSRSTAPAHVDGAAKSIGYLSDLRVAPEYRRGTLLARGYRYFRALHDADPVPFYTTVIYDGNARALETLATPGGGRAGLPHYREWGRLLTPALHLDFAVKPAAVAGVTVERGSRERLAQIVGFLNRWQSRKQFAPVYRESDFGDRSQGRFRGLTAGDFYLAMRGRRIVGTIAVWDQSAFRQTHVERYSAGLALLRPAYNALAGVLPLKRLPAPGARIPSVYLACLATENDEVNLFRFLLRAVHDVIRRGPWHFAVAGLHESDPRAAVLAEMRHIPAAGRLFAVHFADQPLFIDSPAQRVPYLEAGCL